ncbi:MULTISPECIES: phosphonate metabolism protein/1,5-bisphosphokinase (PRPP-forming) PhnN [Pseudomonas]|uniref:Ribose 1,5-bisphosphate phosphokinase PhnN n=1 Tax=Pseudomonas eucalypticola TaxID=2599595 RepID=A0A7D5H5K5_9PSED|nr:MULTISPECIES: phosphonate metabolism protein/1,5-bisphosphokinase (PRPP-forming) PhnN [Pseudomonas]QKZ03584.1 phosphonate metabolism protein/1,5-bisphosphokinase (PRPP-forming) PhnN [Pseudomonas eucalypticola]
MSGRVIYLMGPSGSGKDSIIEAARAALAQVGVQVARRIITRSAEAVGEDAIGVSPDAFARMREAGEFAMDWQANGLQYGIGADINARLTRGQHVLANGSRAWLPHALQRYPDLLPVLVTVDTRVLRQRLLARGRESVHDIEQRLARNERLQADAGQWKEGGVRIEALDNSADLASAVQRLLALLARHGINATTGRT